MKIKACIVFVAVAILMMSSASDVIPSLIESLQQFNNDLFGEIIKSKKDESVIYSPFSIHACLTMARIGAEGETAAELDKVLRINDKNIENIIQNYYLLFNQYKNSEHIHIANKMYIKEGLAVRDEFTNILKVQSFSPSESIDFANSNEAAKTMNKWVEKKTNNNIKNLVKANQLSDDTRLIMLNALHFHGEWETKFSTIMTRSEEFHNDGHNTVQVPMMCRTFEMEYGAFPALNAKAIRLPYKNSDFSMLIVLPDSRTGLADAQDKLMEMNLDSITKGLRKQNVRLYLPKFTVETEIVLNEPLKELGLNHIFDNANFNGIFENEESVSVSKILHKAFITVSEDGTDASAATSLLMDRRNNAELFDVRHPFYYAIINEDNVIMFQGNVAKLDNVIDDDIDDDIDE